MVVDQSVGPVKWATPGTLAGFSILQQFLNKRLKLFGSKRNDPTVDALSNLSPWFHFGMYYTDIDLCYTLKQNFSRYLDNKLCKYNQRGELPL